MTKKEKKKIIIASVILFVILLVIGICLLDPVIVSPKSITVMSFSDSTFKIMKNEVSRAKTDSSKYQVFGILPDEMKKKDDYINAFFYVDVKSFSFKDIESCQIMFSDVDNSDGRFILSYSSEFAATIYAFQSKQCYNHILIDRSGLSDEELELLLKKTEIQVICNYNSGSPKIIRKKLSSAIVVEYDQYEEV